MGNAHKSEFLKKMIGGIYYWKSILQLFLPPVVSFLNTKEHLSADSKLILKMHQYSMFTLFPLLWAAENL